VVFYAAITATEELHVLVGHTVDVHVTNGSGAITTSIVALVGVVIGALLNGGGQALLERSRARKQVRAAGHLVEVELIQKLGAVTFLQMQKRWFAPTQIPGLEGEGAWLEARGTLADTETGIWHTVSRVYIHLEDIRRRAAAKSSAALSDRDMISVDSAAKAISEAFAYVRELTARPPWYRPRELRRYYKSRSESRRKIEAARLGEVATAERDRETKSQAV
jgi:hypothetical protein